MLANISTRTINTVAALSVAAMVGLTACGTDDSGRSTGDTEVPLTVQRTSDTTFYVADNEGYRPDLGLRRTCESVGMVVVDVSPSGAYDDAINVVCGPAS